MAQKMKRLGVCYSKKDMIMKLITLKTSVTAFALAIFSLGMAQAPGDASALLQKCVDLPALQEYFSGENGQTPDALHVMECTLPFSAQGVEKFGNPLGSISKMEVQDPQYSDYLQFYLFEINESAARVDFKYYRKDRDPGVVQVYLECVKSGGNWEVTTQKIRED